MPTRIWWSSLDRVDPGEAARLTHRHRSDALEESRQHSERVVCERVSDRLRGDRSFIRRDGAGQVRHRCVTRASARTEPRSTSRALAARGGAGSPKRCPRSDRLDEHCAAGKPRATRRILKFKSQCADGRPMVRVRTTAALALALPIMTACGAEPDLQFNVAGIDAEVHEIQVVPWGKLCPDPGFTVSVVETSETVQLELHGERNTPVGDDGCSRITVPLETPQGDRTFIHTDGTGVWPIMRDPID